MRQAADGASRFVPSALWASPRRSVRTSDRDVCTSKDPLPARRASREFARLPSGWLVKMNLIDVRSIACIDGGQMSTPSMQAGGRGYVSGGGRKNTRFGLPRSDRYLAHDVAAEFPVHTGIQSAVRPGPVCSRARCQVYATQSRGTCESRNQGSGSASTG